MKMIVSVLRGLGLLAMLCGVSSCASRSPAVVRSEPPAMRGKSMCAVGGAVTGPSQEDSVKRLRAILDRQKAVEKDINDTTVELAKTRDAVKRQELDARLKRMEQLQAQLTRVGRLTMRHMSRTVAGEVLGWPREGKPSPESRKK